MRLKVQLPDDFNNRLDRLEAQLKSGFGVIVLCVGLALIAVIVGLANAN